jgi:hypothetical protein
MLIETLDTRCSRSAAQRISRRHDRGRVCSRGAGESRSARGQYDQRRRGGACSNCQDCVGKRGPAIGRRGAALSCSLLLPVIGGVALAGGSGKMLQAFYGVLILGVMSNALNMAGISSFLQVLIVGLVILLAVIVNRIRGEPRGKLT